jgi:hypothetical protein
MIIYGVLNRYAVHQGMLKAEATHTASESCSGCTVGHENDDNMLIPHVGDIVLDILARGNCPLAYFVL